MESKSTYIAAEAIRALRERRGITQRALADAVGVTDKAVSKWETGRGLPDVTLVEPLAGALGVSVAELLAGEARENANRAGNVARSVVHACPLCGNVVLSLGEGSFSCCGSALIPCEPEAPDDGHPISVEVVDGEWLVSLDHPMDKSHHISFVAYITSGGLHLSKLYPEQQCLARFRSQGSGRILAYCNRHGLFECRTPAIRRKRDLPVWLQEDQPGC
mgnify:CR=1 FL=1